MYYQYELSTSRIIKQFKTMSAAKAAITRASNKWKKQQRYNFSIGKPLTEDPQFAHGAAEAAYYHKNIEKFVTRKNMMTGKKFKESVNTPNYMSPASEAYWSM